MIRQQSGFTAIELLITLFVAAAFLIAGYQLFNVVVKDGGQSRAESRAGNVAYDYMRRYSPSATNPCTSQTLLSNSSLSIDGLSNARMTVVISCPDYSTTSLSKIDVTITYNTPQETVKYSSFVNGTGTPAADITNGLVGWWKLNGSGTASVGSANATLTGATLTSGQSGLTNGAYAFSGASSQYGTIASNFGLGNTNVTISAWVNPAVSPNSGLFFKIGGPASTNGYGLGMGNTTFDDSSSGTKLILLYEGVRWIPTTTDIITGWHHVVMTIDSNGVPSAYLDSSLVGTYSGSNAIAPTTSMSYIGGGMTTARYFNGSIDDVRVYNRALSGSEISALFTGGAK
jgi:prepilin-type N-terminal cleavage/methylation domain-containing protein